MMPKEKMEQEAEKLWDVGWRFIQSQGELDAAVAKRWWMPRFRKIYGEHQKRMEDLLSAITEVQQSVGEELREARAIVEGRSS